MRILSANVNGLSAAFKNGFFELPHVVGADLLCLQETRCDSTGTIGRRLGYHVAHAEASVSVVTGKKSHGGVAIFSKRPLELVSPKGCEYLFNRGQFVACSVGRVIASSVYVTLDYAPAQFAAFSSCFEALAADSNEVAIGGDMNIFLGAGDSWRFREARDRVEAGCDPAAMKWFAGIFSEGWIDIVKRESKPRPLHTWWWSAQKHRELKGTRLDYLLFSPALAARAVPDSAAVHSEKRFGGHGQIEVSFTS